MTNRCNLNITVMEPWWTMQLGLPRDATPELRYAAFEEAFPGLLTFEADEGAHSVDDPNHGNTMLLALGAEMFQTSDGEYDIKRMTVEQVGALRPPDYHTDRHVQALRQAILTTKARYGRVSNESYSGLLHLLWMLRGQDAFTDFYEYPEETHQLIAVLEETLRRHLMFLKDTCGELAYFVLGSCKNCMISPQIYDDFFREPESRISTLSTYLMGRPRAMGIHHCGKKVDAYLDTYAKIVELEMLEAAWDSDIALATRKIPHLKFKPVLDPLHLDDLSEDGVSDFVRQLFAYDAVVEIQAFGITQFFTVARMRRLLEEVIILNEQRGFVGYTRLFA